MATDQQAPGSPLLKLPEEVLMIILRKIRNPRDLSRLSRVCKDAHARVLPQLYQHLDLRIPRLWKGHLQFLEDLLMLPSRGLEYTSSLSVNMTPEDRDWCVNYDYGAIDHQSQASTIQQPSKMHCISLNHMIRHLTCRIPLGHLIVFSWHHDCTLENLSIETLQTRNGSTLQEFLVSQVAESRYRKSIRLPILKNFAHTTSEDFQYSDQTLHNSHLLLSGLARSTHTLRRLKFGYEVKMSPFHAGPSHEAAIYRYLHDDLVDRSGNEDCRPKFNLQFLHLVGIVLRKPLPGAPLIFTNLEVLQSLCLESCNGILQLLKSLTSFANIQLKRFWLRCEEDTVEFRTALNSFLESFSGLEHLAILLDNAQAPLKIGKLTDKHGMTLKTLVWESRQGPRRTLSVNTSYPMDKSSKDYSDLELICGKCMQLEELGIAIDWNGKLENRVKVAWEISHLPNLQTCHIRNHPVVSTSTVSLLNTNTFWEEQEGTGGTHFATFMAELFFKEIFSLPSRSSGKGSSKPGIIAIGASTVASSRVDKQLEDCSTTDDILKPRVFEVRKYRHADGEQIRRVRLIGEGLNALDDAKYHSDYLSILESRWAN